MAWLLERYVVLSASPCLITRLVLIALILPLIAAILLGVAPKRLRLGWLATLLIFFTLGLCCCCLLATNKGHVFHSSLAWFSLQAGASIKVFSLGIYLDFVAAVMLCLVSFISFLVYLYSIPYLQEDPSNHRYFALLSLFVGAMLWLVVADNLLGIFVGWELVGLASYLLVGFWYQQAAAAKASTQAWLMNKLGSVLFLAGLLLIGRELGSFSLTTLSSIPPTVGCPNQWLIVAGACLLVGVFTKSAQLPFFSWLPSAMAAPTPVSALLHAATMVSAGIYLLARVAPMLHAGLLSIVAFVGGLTALMGAYAALAQHHLKRMLAYSTLSQLGYVVVAIGVGASGAGLLYLVMHAFFKACLFLCVGAISYCLGQLGIQGAATQDMRKLGGLGQAMPWTFLAYLVATLALIGMPGFAGFVAKKAILAHTLSWAMQQAQAGYYLGYVVPALSFGASLLTVVYIGRSCWLVFLASPQWKVGSALGATGSTKHSLPLPMQLSIMVLACCSLGLPYHLLSPSFSHNGLWQRLQPTTISSLTTLPLAIPQAIQHAAAIIAVLMLVIGMLAAGLSLLLGSARLAQLFPNLAQLSLHGWYLEAITGLVAKQVVAWGRWANRIDQKLVDGLIDGLAISYVVLGHSLAWLDSQLVERVVYFVVSVLRGLGRLYSYGQHGDLQRYLWWTCIGAALLLVWWLC